MAKRKSEKWYAHKGRLEDNRMTKIINEIYTRRKKRTGTTTQRWRQTEDVTSSLA